MPFTQQLARVGSIGGSGIYGAGAPDDTLSLVNKLKDREMADFKDKANFMSDLSIRQEQRMRNLYDPSKANDGSNIAPPQQAGGDQSILQNPTNNPMHGMNPKDIADFNLKSQELAQKGKFGQEALDIKTAQEKLNQQKSDQIKDQKANELQAKIDEANKKIAQHQADMKTKEGDFQAQLALHKSLADVTEERHKLEMEKMKHDMSLKDEQFQELKKQHEQAIKDKESTTTTTEIDASGNKKTVSTKRGDAAATIDVQGKDGKTYTIPKDKLNDMDSDGTPHWKQVGGGPTDQSNEDNE